MALIVIEKPATRTAMKLVISKQLVDEFESELAIFNKNNKGEKLNFDNFAAKLIDELKKINNKKDNRVVTSDVTDEPLN
jgi:hypothetical protein